MLTVSTAPFYGTTISNYSECSSRFANPAQAVQDPHLQNVLTALSLLILTCGRITAGLVTAARTACRGLFATHYHRLANEHATDPAVSIRHMGCAVQAGRADGMPEFVTFLYTLADGACPKSYGAPRSRAPASQYGLQVAAGPHPHSWTENDSLCRDALTRNSSCSPLAWCVRSAHLRRK